MQHRYTGDIGDFAKYGLLRALGAGFRLGVAWYLYPDESHNKDGRHVDYLEQPTVWRHLDAELFDALKHIVDSGRRNLTEVELSGILPNAVFSGQPLSFAGGLEEGVIKRATWFRQVQEDLRDADLVFMDPDNGLRDNVSYDLGKQAMWKSIPVSEVEALSDGRPAVIYHHNTRFAGGHEREIQYWLERFGADAVALYWPKFSPRTFLVLHPTDVIRERIESLLARWSSLFTLHSRSGSRGEQQSERSSFETSNEHAPKSCPECGHEFSGTGWGGIDAHWKAKHQSIMPYQDAWPIIRSGGKPSVQRGGGSQHAAQDAAPSFVLRLPFRLPAGQELSKLEEVSSRTISGLNLSLKETSGWYGLNLKGFGSEEEAEAFIPRAYAALMWTVLQMGISPEFATETQSVRYQDDPERAAKNLSKSFDLKIDRLDALIDGSQPAVYRADKQVRTITGGIANIIHGLPSEGVAQRLSEAISFRNSDQVFCNEKLRLALDLYATHFREATQNARFLTLAMVLEVLAPREQKPPLVVEKLKTWIAELQIVMSELPQDSENWAAFESLKNELDFRREMSIRKRVRSLVYETLGNRGDEDAADTAKDAVLLYDIRSRLIHDGCLRSSDFSDPTSRLREIVRRVLEARFLTVAV